MLRTAGSVEMNKWKEDYKLGKRSSPDVPASWRPVIGVEYDYSAKERAGNTTPVLGWPYGDNPENSKWIIRGFNYYKGNKK